MYIVQPFARKAYGAMKWITNIKGNGVIESVSEKELSTLVNLTSYRRHQLFKTTGDSVKLTTNCFTWLGSFSLANHSKETLESDYNL
jgi:hypothetical protein